jgi:hypothetical protein
MSVRKVKDIIQPKQDRLLDTERMLTTYREERQRQDQLYREAVNYERQRRAAAAKREVANEPMPWDLEMPVLKPVSGNHLGSVLQAWSRRLLGPMAPD